MKQNTDEISKLRALRLWDSGEIEALEVGTFRGLREIHSRFFDGLEGYNAGEIRQVNIAKDNFMFASALYLNSALEAIERMPENSFDEIIDKYVEMNIAHPFIEGNGRSTRLWLDMILRKNLEVCIEWNRINKVDYLNFMRLSPINSKYIKQLLSESLTPNIYDRVVFMKGIDQSYEYEDSNSASIFQLDEE